MQIQKSKLGKILERLLIPFLVITLIFSDPAIGAVTQRLMQESSTDLRPLATCQVEKSIWKKLSKTITGSANTVANTFEDTANTAVDALEDAAITVAKFIVTVPNAALGGITDSYKWSVTSV